MTEAAASGPSRGRVAGLTLRGPARLLSDERLARRATSGDERCFEEIFRRYHQDLYRFCLATVSNPHDAQEALQNTMVKVMRALPGEQREIKLKPWLFRIARNEAVETLRRRRDTVELGDDRIAMPGELTDAADARERLRELFSDLAELPERQRSALVMRELAGLEFTEIGEAFGTSAAVARQTLYEARQSLRQMDEGREMSCAQVRKAISDADGRVTRRRGIRAHLRDCAGCRAFRDDIARRHQDFAAVAALPAAVSVGLLQGLLSGQASSAAVAAGAGGASSGGIGATVGMGAGKAVAGSALVKSAATVAVVAAVGAGAADRGGLIDLPRPGGDKGAATPRTGAESASDRSSAAGAADSAKSAADGRARSADVASAGGRRAGSGRGKPASNRAVKKGARPPKRANGRPPHAGKPSHASRGKRAVPPRPDGAGNARNVAPSPPRGTPAAQKPSTSPGRKPSTVPSAGTPPTAPPGKNATPPSSAPPASGDASVPPPAAPVPPIPAPSAKGTAPSNKRPAPPPAD
ncbi:MAG TPA: sigma-70 family RNA polymerase sigma factor [Solirubrobacterales bacterium]|nr:sigma-70 family RNA polymerase sigma factor [Solirubrobacterales bacterium]